MSLDKLVFLFFHLFFHLFFMNQIPRLGRMESLRGLLLGQPRFNQSLKLVTCIPVLTNMRIMILFLRYIIHRSSQWSARAEDQDSRGNSP